MSKTHLWFCDAHAKPGVNNDRAAWLGELIADVKPDVVICGGDIADMESLCSYDRGKKSFQGRTYSADIDSHSDFQDRLWSTVRKRKKRLPKRVALIGNHEERIRRAIEVQPELEGVISYGDLDLESFYDEVVDYEGSTPGQFNEGGIGYSHYMVSGISGRAISGEHPAHSLLVKCHSSCVVGHSHLLDYSVKTRGSDNKKIMGLVGGCYMEHNPSFAGVASQLWWRGVCILRNVEDGCFDLQTISLSQIKKAYKGNKNVRR